MAADQDEDGGPPPSNTVYVRNLDDRVKIPALIAALEEVFSAFGDILEIVAKPNLKAKGQAFVVYADAESAQAAIDEAQGFDMFNKPMSLDFAKTKSDAQLKQELPEDEFEKHKERRLAEKKRKEKERLADLEQQAKLKRPAPVEDAAVAASARPIKANRGAGLKSTGGAGAVVPDEYLPPNKILFVQNLPEDYDVEALTAVFNRFDGFREVRMVPGRKGLAFVEYEAEAGAITAKENTGGITLGGERKPIKVTFQRQ